MRRSIERLFQHSPLLAALLVALVCPAASAQVAERPASVIVAVVPGIDADPAYQAVLRDALIVTLARNGMKASAAGTPSEARDAAKQQKADYLVLGTWSNTAETIELSVALWLPDGKAPRASGKASSRIGLSMDTVAGEALAQVLPSMQASFPADATAVTAGSRTAGGSRIAVGPPAEGAVAGEEAERWRRVELAFGGAPLVNTGVLADYAKVGAFSALDLDFRFPIGRGALAPGLLAACGWFRADGSGIADVLVVPIGPDIHWAIARGANPGVSLHAAAGPALIVAITSWADTALKLAPFVVGGLDVDIGLTHALGLRIEADYLVIFEGSMVLQALVPRLSLRIRF